MTNLSGFRAMCPTFSYWGVILYLINHAIFIAVHVFMLFTHNFGDPAVNVVSLIPLIIGLMGVYYVFRRRIKGIWFMAIGATWPPTGWVIALIIAISLFSKKDGNNLLAILD